MKEKLLNIFKKERIATTEATIPNVSVWQKADKKSKSAIKAKIKSSMFFNTTLSLTNL